MKTTPFFLIPTILIFLAMASCQNAGKGEVPEQYQYYGEKHRPQFHFTPDSMWMNDPNGMVFYEGEYHLFYQYHPHSNVWGPMHWGHAISPDLVHWEHLPIALYPDSLGTIFSGSAVIDWNNSSGLGDGLKPPMVAIFTHHNHELEKAGSDVYQYQSIAYSLDRGRTWTKYPGNPVLENPGIRDFRDPKVSWYEKDQKWLMVFAAQDRILFYSSPNLLQWQKESEFSVEMAAGEGVWECPDFFPMSIDEEEKWVLLVSIGDGGPNGGSGTKYYVGDFDGKQFICNHPDEGPHWLDFGKDNYAGVTWSDIPSEDGRRLFMGWMSNWQYANKVPTERWRSAMTLPRELKLVESQNGYNLLSIPLVETTVLRAGESSIEPGEIEDKQALALDLEGQEALYEIDLVFELDEASGPDTEFGIILENKEGETVQAGFSMAGHEIFIDRSLSGETDFSEQFPGKHTAPFQVAENGSLRLHAFVDQSSIELFVDGGEVVMTELFFPTTPFDQIRLYSNNRNIRLKSGHIYTLQGAIRSH